jgi:gamma-glutamyltranspeptidase
MTNKEFRDNLAKEMRSAYEERNRQLEEAENLPVNKFVKKHTKKKIMETFYKKIDELKKRP